MADDALVVNCAADGLKMPPLVPIWQPEAITAATGQGRVPLLRRSDHRVRRGDPRRRRREEPAVPRRRRSATPWRTGRRMNVLGMRNSASFGSEPDIKDWSNRVALNPARIPPEHGGSPELDDALDRMRAHTPAGLARLAELSTLD